MTSAALTKSSADANRLAYQALGLWGVFFVVNAILHQTIPFALSGQVPDWLFPISEGFAYHFLIYGILFLIGSLLLSKGWEKVKQSSFLIPLIVAVGAITIRPAIPLAPLLVLLVLACLNWRFDLSGLGIRSSGWKGDALVVAALGLMYAVPSLLRPIGTLNWQNASLAAIDRMLGNPAASAEILFYFGFLTPRLASITGTWLTPPLIGLMYTAHEMENPEYWMSGMSFPFVFVGVTVVAAIYLWRKSLIPIWLGDGLGRFLTRLG